MIRRSTHFTGRVQGVGFRYTTLDIARGFAVVGYVQNLPDGRVELVCEGEADEITRFVEAIAHRMQAYIKNRMDFDSPATGEYHAFAVR